MEWYLKVWRDYFNFSDRSRRTEYWMFTLFNMLVFIVIGVVAAVLGDWVGALSTLYGIAAFIPSLAVTIRRLHDTGRSGFWCLIALVPVLGVIVLLIFMILDSEPGTNQYGPNPKGA